MRAPPLDEHDAEQRRRCALDRAVVGGVQGRERQVVADVHRFERRRVRVERVWYRVLPAHIPVARFVEPGSAVVSRLGKTS